MGLHPRIYQSLVESGIIENRKVPPLAIETLRSVEDEVMSPLDAVDGDLARVAKAIRDGRTSDALRLLETVQASMDKSRMRFVMIRDTFPTPVFT